MEPSREPRRDLSRCLAFAECRTLVPATGPCPACVAPHLAVAPGADVRSPAGAQPAVLVLSNTSTAARPFWVTSMARLDGHSPEPLDLAPQQVDAGTERHVAVTPSPLAAGGARELRVVFVIATRYGGIEEAYAFTAAVPTVSSSPGAPLPERRALRLERAERYELAHRVRGYHADDVRVPRHVRFGFPGFRDAERPADGATLAPGGRLSCGRNSRAARSTGAMPNDLCLRVYDRDGRLDEPATMAISRHHFDLVVVNDRLCVHVHSSRGLQINDRSVASGELRAVAPGDRIVTIPGRPDKLSLQVAFTTAGGVVERVDLSRMPAVS